MTTARSRLSELSFARPRRRPARSGRTLVVVGALGVVALQVCYPLLDAGATRNRVTVSTVVTFAIVSALHALLYRGVRWTLGYLVLAAGGGFAAEAVGVATGLPFGDYSYRDSLGPRLLDVPVVVALAWAMMAYPALVAARRLVRRRPAQAVVGAWALAAWDLFLDPQMVDAGHWAWADPDPALPGVHGVPVSNYLGWLAVALVLMAALSLLPRRRTEDGVPVALYLWTFAGSVLANLVWFDRPAVALWGGLGMGLVAVPLCRTVLSPPRP